MNSMQANCLKCNSPYYLSERQSAVGYFTCDACGSLNPLPHPPGSSKNTITTTNSSKDWHILRNTGQRFTFQGLVKLQELIANNEVTVEDLLSRDGKKWKRLGDIAELGGIFAEAKKLRSMPFGSYDGPPQTMLMSTAIPRSSNSPPATLNMPSHLERPSSTNQQELSGRDMEFTSKGARVAPKEAPPQILTAVSTAPVVLSEHRPVSSPSAIKGVQGFNVREESSRYSETPKLPFATTAPPEARERLAAVTPLSLKIAAKIPEASFDNYLPQVKPASTESKPPPTETTSTMQYPSTRAPVLVAPSGRFSALDRSSSSPSGAYLPRTNTEQAFPARPASPQIPEGPKAPSGIFPSLDRSSSGSYLVEENDEAQPETPLSTLRFHTAAETQFSNEPPSTLKMGGFQKANGAEALRTVARGASGRFPTAASRPDPMMQLSASADHLLHAEHEHTETLRMGAGQIIDPTATIPQLPNVVLFDEEEEKQKTTLQGVGSVPARKRAPEEILAPYFSDSPILFTSITTTPDPNDTEPKTEPLRASSRSSKSSEFSAMSERALSGLLASDSPDELSEEPPNPPVIRSLLSSPLFEKKPSKVDVEPESAAPVLVKPEDDWRLSSKPIVEEAPFVKEKKTPAWLWVFGLLLLGVLAGLVSKRVFLFHEEKATVTPLPATDVVVPTLSKQQQFTIEGEALLLLDDDESLKKSQSMFLRALGSEENYVPALRGLLLSYTILGVRVEQEQTLETQRLEFLSKEEAAKLQVILEANQKKREQDSLFTEAAQYAEKLSAIIAPQPELATQAALGEFQFATKDKGLPSTLSLVSKFPGSWQENWLLALASSRKDTAKAKSLLAEVTAQRPELLRARYQLAVLLLQDKNISAARQEAEAILKLNPKHARAALLLERWPESASLPAVTPQDPATPVVTPDKGLQTASDWVQEGDRKMKAGKTSDALDAYLEAASQDRRHLPAFLKAGNAYMKLKRPDYACSQYLFALTIASDNADALFGLSSCSLQMGNQSEAKKRFEQYLSLYPQGTHATAAQKRLDDLNKKLPTSAPIP
jgi:tetratricopeptide (TPR) repeat protein